jgi:GAF domain-containing protein
MNPHELARELGNLIGGSASLEEAVQWIGRVLERETALAAVIFDNLKDDSGPVYLAAPDVRNFVQRLASPYRSLSSVPVAAQGRTLGKLVIYFAGTGPYPVPPAELLEFIGEQLALFATGAQEGGGVAELVQAR